MKRTQSIIAVFAISAISCAKVFAQVKTNISSDHTLDINRKRIDSLDKKLIEVLGERERIVKEIGFYKAKNNIAPLQAARFQQVVANGILAGQKEGLSAAFITEMLNAIHKESLRIEEAVKPK